MLDARARLPLAAQAAPIAALSSYRLAHIGLDVAIAAAAYGGAIAADALFRGAWLAPSLCLGLLPAWLAVRAACPVALKLDRQVWRFTGPRELRTLALSTFLGTALLGALALLLPEHRLGVLLAVDAGLNLAGQIGIRSLRRAQVGKRVPRHAPATRVLLVGAGEAGNRLAKEILHRNPELEPVGFVDDAPHKAGCFIQGLEVLGSCDRIPALARRYGVSQVLLCITGLTPAGKHRILSLCRQAGLTVCTPPGLQALLMGARPAGPAPAVDVESLLNRPPVSFDREAAAGYLRDRVVLVTGAGGSIGSELCRQIAELGPRRLLLLGRGEFSIYTVELELKERHPEVEIVPLIADVRDPVRLRHLFERYRPEVVFHAAAHKHVPLMERNASEAILNNVVGTRNVAELASRYGASAFVLISSDKAVNPTNVMGASKRVCELIVQELAGRSKTHFMAVRFGNVLGSRGSVLPLFERQIAKGGPLTLTHPEVIRYFMTVSEASQLVLQAGALGQSGEVFVLDMGEPVRILDLARSLIELAGLKPERDIPITFTGLRPGEKLYEELLTEAEGTRATRYRKLFVAPCQRIERARLKAGLTRLQRAAQRGDDDAIREGLQALVESYVYPRAPRAAS